MLRPSDLRFLLAWLLPGAMLGGVLSGSAAAGGWAFAVWATIALVDACWPGAQRSPPAAAGTPPVLRWVLRLYVPLHMLLIAAGLWAAARADWGGVLALGLAVGFVTGGQGITFAHELGHSRRRLDRVLAWALMASVGYAHFMVEHYRGHHPRAATWADPASARRGESLWRFLPRTLVGSWVSAWTLERARLAQRGLGWARSPLAACVALNLLFCGVLLASGATKMLAFWAIQAAFAVWLLETVNYIEHYGLRRADGPGGRPEPFGLHHAWNADHVLSNSLLANLQRHSDHHMQAWKPYPELQALPGPQLPTGYAGCLLLAAVPPLWFSLMHKRLDAMGPPA